MEKFMHETHKTDRTFKIKFQKDEMNELVHKTFPNSEIKVEDVKEVEVTETSLVSQVETKIFELAKLQEENDSLTDQKNITDLQGQNIKLEGSESLVVLNSLRTEIKIEEDEIDEDHLADLTEHKIVCVGNKLFQCDTCNKTFTYPSHLKAHERIHSGEKPYECNICSKTFTTSSNLNRHGRIHRDEKPYECNICSKTFSDLSNLKTHERIHSREKPYKCIKCIKTFTVLGNLKTHEKIHSGETPYQCKICTKWFRDLTWLREHEIFFHNGEKPYKCKICSKTFVTSYQLKTHERIHSDGKSYECNQGWEKCFIETI